LTLYVKI